MDVSQVTVGGRHAVVLSQDGLKVVFDVARSTAWDLDDDEAGALAALAAAPDEALRAAALELAPASISARIADGRLLGPDDRRGPAPQERKLRLYEVVVQIAYTCNMACTYCYADEGRYGGGDDYMMSEQVARDAIDFVFRHRGSDTVGFGLLGGEPLMNLKTVKTFVTYAREKGAREGVRTEFSVTTNGLPLGDRVLAFLKEHGIAVRLSVDGTKAIHDKYRPDKKRLPTFDRVAARGAALRESGVDYMVRASILGPEGDQLLEQVRTLFEDQGYRRVKVDFLWGTDGTPGLVDQSNLPLVIKGIDELGRWFRERVARSELSWRQLLPFSKYIGRLRKPPQVAPVYLGSDEVADQTTFGASVLENNGVECGAGVNVISISANGDLYSCHRTEGNPNYKIGSIYEGVRPEALEYWHSRWRLTESDCQTCWARYVCIGGCPAFGVYKYADPMKVDQMKCSMRRRFIAWSILIHRDMQERSIDEPAGSCGSDCDRQCNEQ